MIRQQERQKTCIGYHGKGARCYYTDCPPERELLIFLWHNCRRFHLAFGRHVQIKEGGKNGSTDRKHDLLMHLYLLRVPSCDHSLEFCSERGVWPRPQNKMISIEF